MTAPFNAVLDVNHLGKPVDDLVLEYLGRHRAASPAHLVTHFDATEEEVMQAVEVLERRGWVLRGSARFIGHPDPEVTIFTLSDAGERVNERRERLALAAERATVVTHDELVGELKRRFGHSDEKIAADPWLRATHYMYYPSIGAYSPLE